MERTRQDILSRSEQYEVKVERLRSNQNNIMAQDVRIQELRAKYAQVTRKPLSRTQDAVDNSETSRRLEIHIAAEPMKESYDDDSDRRAGMKARLVGGISSAVAAINEVSKGIMTPFEKDLDKANAARTPSTKTSR